MDSGRRSRLLILIVAYHAEATIGSVLARIPRELPGVDAQILVLDDGSADATFERACSDAQVPWPIEVLRNPVNQGYGGNQKIGYHYAIAHGFDYVALIHGDGQYAPEALPRLLQPLLDGAVEAVFGSRMMQGRQALRGGMPLYKFVGNRILTWAQNRIAGTSLREFHCGYRLYSVRALAGIDFRRNTNGFHFDTEIILQLLSGGYRYRELPIRTHYGDEVCRVNGLSYAVQVLAATLRWKAQRLGLLHDPKYDLPGRVERYEPKLDFPSTHRWVVDSIPGGATVLDIGCSGGHVSAALAAKGCRTIGIDCEPPAGAVGLARFLRKDLDDGLPDPEERVEYVLALDVIEHLKRPERLASEIHLLASRNRDLRLVISTGNIAFCVIRLMLLLGQFNYGRRGILDLTHTRLFTFGSLRRLLEDHAFEVERVVGIPAPFPLALGRSRLASALLRLNAVLIRLSRRLFAYQMLMVCRPLPALDWLLADAVAAKLAGGPRDAAGRSRPAQPLRAPPGARQLR